MNDNVGGGFHAAPNYALRGQAWKPAPTLAQTSTCHQHYQLQCYLHHLYPL